MTSNKFAPAILATAVLLTVAYAVLFLGMYIKFNRNCGGYLYQAAAANTVEMAKSRLDVAIAYIEKENLTSGYTSIIYQTPADDIGFWYANLKASRGELDRLDGNADLLTATNTLIKLRESITDQGKNGTKLFVPTGIARYPYNTAMAIHAMAIIFLWGLTLLVYRELF